MPLEDTREALAVNFIANDRVPPCYLAAGARSSGLTGDVETSSTERTGSLFPCMGGLRFESKVRLTTCSF